MAEQAIYEQIVACCEAITNADPEDWHDRELALQNLLLIFKYNKENAPELFTRDALRPLDEIILVQLNDLRSAIIRESCAILLEVANVVGDTDGARKLVDHVAACLLEHCASGNKVIVHYMKDTILHLSSRVHISCMHFVRKASSRSPTVREVALVAMEHNINAKLDDIERNRLEVFTCIETSLRDASARVRQQARRVLLLLLKQYPKPIERILVGLDMRDQRLLRREIKDMGILSEEDTSETAEKDPSAQVLKNSLMRQRSLSRQNVLQAVAVYDGSDAPTMLPVAVQVEPAANPSPPVFDHEPGPNTIPLETSTPLRMTRSFLLKNRPKDTAQNIVNPGTLPAIGTRVICRLRKGTPQGIVRFVGQTHFSDGIWIGIELDTSEFGKNDGMVKEKRYFKTAPGRGIFLRPHHLRLAFSQAAPFSMHTDAIHEESEEEAVGEHSATESTVTSRKLLFQHRLHADLVLETLKRELQLISGLQGVSDTGNVTPAELNSYVESIQACFMRREKMLYDFRDFIDATLTSAVRKMGRVRLSKAGGPVGRSRGPSIASEARTEMRDALEEREESETDAEVIEDEENVLDMPKEEEGEEEEEDEDFEEEELGEEDVEEGEVQLEE